MALEFLVNPRGAPRARARCAVAATVAGVAFQGQTEDVGPHGCLLVAPRPVARGSAIQLVLRAPGAAEVLEVAGVVAWASPQAPWRLGVAFAEGARPAAGRFFEALVASQPGLASWRQVPDRISLDAMVWLAPPPKLVVDFNADEVAVLTAVGTGATVFELKSRLRARWGAAERAFFSLLAGRFLT
ncbi:MAG: PilZ domain-containing protein, partial [Anaeromyxobacteraceae bacterium]|nr:PilZ domain-containing protein [Anaeromyxobacteraceae bacterium]